MDNGGDASKRIFTVPNILSMFRILLIPLIVYLYMVRGSYRGAAAVLLLSAATDILDGWIARHFNLISDFGKFLDPCADKLTQMTILCCLTKTWPHMLIAVTMLVIKELTDAYTSMWVIKQSGQVLGAEWHGKMATVFIHATMVTHIVWHSIPAALSDAMIILSSLAMLLSMILYMIRNMTVALEAKRKNESKEKESA